MNPFTGISETLREARSKDAPRADMYLPMFMFGFSVFLLLCGVGCIAASAVIMDAWPLLVALPALVLGAAALLCWKNQTIKIVSEDEFVYTTFLGNPFTYRFSEITDMKSNPDSVTVCVGERKIHMESMAIKSDRLNRRLETAFYRSLDAGK